MSQDDPPPLKPYYWADRDEIIVLYRGSFQASKPDQGSVSATGEIRFEWLPSPHLSFAAWAYEGGIPGALDPLTPGEISLDLASPEAALEFRDYGDAQEAPEEAVVRARGGLPPREFGNSEALHRMVICVLNLNDFLGTRTTRVNHGWARNRIELATHDWLIVLDSRKDLSATIADLRSTGAFAFTHVAEIRRRDESPFSVEDTKALLDLLFHFLAFARGRLVGLALPVGLDVDDTPRWVNWHTTTVDPWRGAISWADPRHAAALEELFPKLASRWEEEFWHDVLRRAIRYYVDANDARPVDRALIMSQAALELLSWSVVVEDQGLLSPRRARNSSAAERIDLLLKWAEIEAATPGHFAKLSELSNNGPEAFTKVRNRLVHPKQSEPPHPIDVMLEAWRLGQYWIELCILRICEFSGVFGDRLMDDRWAGQIEQVPWVGGES